LILHLVIAIFAHSGTPAPKNASGCSWKLSCTWYHTLEDPDKLRDCNRYKERD